MVKITTKSAIESDKEDKKGSTDNNSSDITITNNPLKISHKLREHMTDLEQIFFIHGDKVASKLGGKDLVNEKLDNIEDREEE